MTTRILVLDDNIDVAQGVAEILELSGYDVTLVHDAPSAVQTYCSQNFNLGLFDVRMPGMNGVDAFMEIKSRRSDANIVLMSGYADDALVADAIAKGARGFLSKPFEPDDMLTRLNELCPN
jgi:CheY-like chemotaxis protein